MTYQYEKKSRRELEGIAQQLLDRFPHCRNGLAVDIERILEELGMDLLPRPMPHCTHAEGYLARDPRLIVVREDIFSYMPRARFTIAEEVCHRILEYDAWEGDGEIPDGAHYHNLSPEQFTKIENDARGLASALLMPKDEFVAAYKTKFRELSATRAKEMAVLEQTLRFVANTFDVSPKAAGWRAIRLKLVARDALNF